MSDIINDDFFDSIAKSMANLKVLEEKRKDIQVANNIEPVEEPEEVDFSYRANALQIHQEVAKIKKVFDPARPTDNLPYIGYRYLDPNAIYRIFYFRGGAVENYWNHLIEENQKTPSFDKNAIAQRSKNFVTLNWLFTLNLANAILELAEVPNDGNDGPIVTIEYDTSQSNLLNAMPIKTITISKNTAKSERYIKYDVAENTINIHWTYGGAPFLREHAESIKNLLHMCIVLPYCTMVYHPRNQWGGVAPSKMKLEDVISVFNMEK